MCFYIGICVHVCFIYLFKIYAPPIGPQPRYEKRKQQGVVRWLNIKIKIKRVYF